MRKPEGRPYICASAVAKEGLRCGVASTLWLMRKCHLAVTKPLQADFGHLHVNISPALFSRHRAIIGLTAEDIQAVEGDCEKAATKIASAQRARLAKHRADEQRRIKDRWEKPLISALEAAHLHAAQERQFAAQERALMQLKHEKQLASLEAEINHYEVLKDAMLDTAQHGNGCAILHAEQDHL